ncbi:hypothetical protein [Sphingomonas sp. PAMC 26617]|uniref:hypothetical protein n=1 Tax=Sphingomonas sp. PAMC 26617 TaxID=1112216 RepID=UPI0002DB4839|nr:hypothetical protein [Sphingomonas sp. PAMC 26617]
MHLRQRLKCLFGYHHRNGYRVRWQNGVRCSVCKGCGQPMIRENQGWRLMQPGEFAG